LLLAVNPYNLSQGISVDCLHQPAKSEISLGVPIHQMHSLFIFFVCKLAVFSPFQCHFGFDLNTIPAARDAQCKFATFFWTWSLTFTFPQSTFTTLVMRLLLNWFKTLRHLVGPNHQQWCLRTHPQSRKQRQITQDCPLCTRELTASKQLI